MSVIALGCINATLAGGGTITVGSSDGKLVSSDYMPPISTAVNYVFDATGVKNLITQKNTLYQVNCNAAAILKSLGFGSASSSIFSLWLQNGNFEYNFDFKNCALQGTRVDANYNYTKSLNDDQALAFAATFMQNTFLKDKAFYKFGKPFILYRNSNGPIYPLMKWGATPVNVTAASDIEIDPTDTGGNVVPEYTSYTIMYPYLIDGQEVWQQYGTRAGMTLDVSADGVISVSAMLLPFKWATRTSAKLSGDDAIRILSNWGNSPFYAQTNTPIKFAAPQKVWVLFTLWKDNKSYLYLSSGIGLKSNAILDQYAQQPYTMILSDYKIGNIAQ